MKAISRSFHSSLLACIRRPGAHAVNTSALHGVRAATGIIFVLAALGSEHAAALDRTWIGGNVDWIDSGSALNWNPNDEPDADDTAIFNTANTVNLGSNNTVIDLTMSGGISLNTNDFDLTINGLLQLSGSGTDLTIGGSASAVSADSATISTSASIILNGGVLAIVEETGFGTLDINATGNLTGVGTFNLNDGSLGAATILLINDGTISATRPGPFSGVPLAGTLSINAPGDVANARLDLDGADLGTLLRVSHNQTLDINVQLSDNYSDNIDLFHNATLDMANPWGIDGDATIDVDNGFVNNGGLLDIPASTSFISGAAFTQSGGIITVIDSDGALQFNAPFTMNNGDLVNTGEVIFNANATIGAGANFTNPTSTSSLTVNAGAEVNVDQLNFNADGAGNESTNVISIGSLGILDLDLGLGGDTDIGSTINLNGGELDVTTDTDTWSITGITNVGAGTGISRLNGEALYLSNVPVTVGDGSTLDVNATSTWATTASASVNTGSILRLNGAASALSGASFTGAGTMVIGSTSTVSASTTVATGTFDWDGAGIGSLQTINDGAVFTITSAVLDSDGDMDDPINLGGSGAGLTVSGPASWEMKGTLTSNPTDTGLATIAGTSRMELTTANGILNVNGDTMISSPVTFGALSSTTVAAPAILTVSGSAIIRAGATFGGAGPLKIQTGSIVSPDNTANINVLVDNSGSLRLASTGTGRVDVKEFQQSATGELEIDLNGTALANYDRLIVGGAAQIDGDLVVNIGGGYVPALGDTFNVLTATSGVLNTFDPLLQPVGMPVGLILEIAYSANLVQLKVVASSPYYAWIYSFVSVTDPADKTKAANPDGDDLNNLGEFALDGNPTNGVSSGKVVGKIAPVGGADAMTLTIPVRSGAVQDPGDPVGGELVLEQVADELTYRIQATDDLSAFTLDVTEVNGADATAIQDGLPALNTGWVYRTFRSPGVVAGDPFEFMRAVISE